MKDDEGTWLLTKRKYYIFTWDFRNYKKTISSSENYLPELDIQAIFSKFYIFSKRVGKISKNSTFNFVFESICTNKEPSTGKPMYFTPVYEDEVISETV